MVSQDYEEFIEKFKPKKTTDDCYTPKAVYDIVLDYVNGITPLDGRKIVRPFWPGGDFENFDYPDGCIVIDNPPFSIYSKIVRWFLERDIDFFLFAPGLTQRVVGADVCYVATMAEVTYENGAVVRTSFTTNIIKDYRLMTAPKLADELRKASKKPTKGQPIVYEYPDNLITLALMGKLNQRGIEFSVRKDECAEVTNIDALRRIKKSLFGGGFLLAERAAAERAAAERAAAERAAARERLKLTLTREELAMIP